MRRREYYIVKTRECEHSLTHHHTDTFADWLQQNLIADEAIDNQLT
jgi:hypothetical protein